MKDYITARIHTALHLLVVALAIVFAVWFVHYSNTEIEERVLESIRTERKVLETLSILTDRNGADSTIESIVADCARRDEYESLLIKLNSLDKKDLITLQNLYERCGTFFAERKALMVAKLARELEIYTHLYELLTVLDSRTPYVEEMKDWNELLTLEQKRSTLLNEQSTIQSKIISALISGNLAHATEVQILVRDAQEIAEHLAVHDHAIDAVRKKLIE